MSCASTQIPAPLRMAQSDRPALCETFPSWLIGLLFSVAVPCIKTASSPGQAHNELSVQRGNPSHLSGNKQWLVDNSSLVQLSQSCSYIRTTGKSLVCPCKMEFVIRSTRKLFGKVWEWDNHFKSYSIFLPNMRKSASLISKQINVWGWVGSFFTFIKLGILWETRCL